MRKYIRSERIFLFEPNIYISLVVKLSGNISAEQFRYAVFAAYQANEVTMSKIVLEQNGDAYYQHIDQSGCKFICENRTWKELLNESERQPFQLKEGEFIRIFLTREDEQNILFVHAHHLVGDGQSILILLQDIFDSLAGKRLQYKSLLSVDHKLLNARAELPWVIEMYVKLLNRKWKNRNTSFSWADYERVHEYYWTKHKSEIIIEQMDVNVCKKKCPRGITLNSFIVTKLLSKNNNYKVVGIPISIREDKGMSNQASGIAIQYRYCCRKSFSDNMVNVHKKIYDKIKNANMRYYVLLFLERLNPVLIDGMMLQTYGCFESKVTKHLMKAMGYTKENCRDLGVTNLGNIKVKSERQDIVMEDILFIPPKISSAEDIYGVATYKEKLSVCHHRVIFP